MLSHPRRTVPSSTRLW